MNLGSNSARIAIGVEYDGASFSGWQIQDSPQVPTVQAELEKALSKVANHPLRVQCAGRTDSKVHASGQIAHFDTPSQRNEKAWVQGCNSLLPGTVRVLWAVEVNPEFHARFSALHRRYFYAISQSKVASAILQGKLTHHRRALDWQAMDKAAQSLLGEQDFSAFRAAGCQSKTAMRNVHHARVFSKNDLIILDIQANAFLQHMVRNIVGSLLKIGHHEKDSSWVAELLCGKNRSLAAATAPSDGLYLVDVGYPQHYGLPEQVNLPYFLR